MEVLLGHHYFWVWSFTRLYTILKCTVKKEHLIVVVSSELKKQLDNVGSIAGRASIRKAFIFRGLICTGAI